MNEKNEPVTVSKPIARTNAAKKPTGKGLASGYSRKAVELYKASKDRFLAKYSKKK